MAALLKFEAFISEAFSFELHLMGFWCNSVFLVPKVSDGKEHGPLLQFNPLWTAPFRQWQDELQSSV
jgi:hypothetical protein